MKTTSEIINAVKNVAKDGKMSCTSARKLAEEFQVPPKVIGDACNELKIKIHGCELGCF
ncbi:MAG: hypothetical protein PHO01_06160 [Desulfotomaculaceae bacterium]|nr:hypothetical protein [Desulfotomaculaceae bacterium]